MNLDELNRWFDELEKSPAEFSEDLDKRAMEHISTHIHADLKKNKNKYSKRFKAASFVLVFWGIISISGITYAAISGRLSGVHVLTPELEEQLDVPNPIQFGMDYPPAQSETHVSGNKYINTVILNDNSFTDPSIYNTVTDYALTAKDDTFYSENEFVFDINDVALFTKENGEAWELNAGDQVTIQIALDTTFAGSDQQGEYVEFAYVKDNKYIPFHLSKLTNTSQTITFQAEESDKYYFAITNASFTYLKITLLEIQ